MLTLMEIVVRREFGPDVRHAALVRAGYCCEKCGSRERLELHHIGNRQDRSAFNAMVLCVVCHAKLHADRRERFGGRPPPAWSGSQA
jgi:hypothetical protein